MQETQRRRFNPWVRKIPGGGNGNSLQYSCLENPMDREPHRLQSIGSHRVRHNWSDLACTHSDQCEAIPYCIGDAEHLYTCLLAICMSFLEKCLFRSFAHFLWLLLLSCMSCLYILEVNLLLVTLQIFSPILWDVFSFCLWFPWVCKSFYIWLGPNCFFLFSVGGGLKKILLE